MTEDADGSRLEGRERRGVGRTDGRTCAAEGRARRRESEGVHPRNGTERRQGDGRKRDSEEAAGMETAQCPEEHIAQGG